MRIAQSFRVHAFFAGAPSSIHRTSKHKHKLFCLFSFGFWATPGSNRA